MTGLATPAWSHGNPGTWAPAAFMAIIMGALAAFQAGALAAFQAGALATGRRCSGVR